MGLHEETNTVMQIHFIPEQVSKTNATKSGFLRDNAITPY